MIADWGVEVYALYEHYIIIQPFLTFLHTQHMTYFENTVLLFSAQLFGLTADECGVVCVYYSLHESS